jgi:hypothetical protein
MDYKNTEMMVLLRYYCGTHMFWDVIFGLVHFLVGSFLVLLGELAFGIFNIL